MAIQDQTEVTEEVTSNEEVVAASSVPDEDGATAAQKLPEDSPFATFPDAESFKKRVDREARKHMRELGITDPEQIKSILSEHAKLKEAAEEAERAKMSEIERLTTDLQSAKSRAEQMEVQYEELRVRNHLVGVFAKKGVKNFDYGFYLVNKKLEELGDSDDAVLDEEAFLDELAADPSTRAALGIAAAGGESAVEDSVPSTPATTTPKTGQAPAPPKSNGLPSKTAMDMSPEEWTQYKQRMGLST